MNNATVSILRDYIVSALSAEDRLWLADEIRNYGQDDDFQMPYTNDELVARAMEGHRQIQNGQCRTNDEVKLGKA